LSYAAFASNGCNSDRAGNKIREIKETKEGREKLLHGNNVQAALVAMATRPWNYMC
jgi:hypothetical protein